MTLADGQAAARLCALNILGQLRSACSGDLDRIVRLVRLAGLVRCTPDFEDQAKVLNAASDLMCDVLGVAGRHARIASGTHALPLGHGRGNRSCCRDPLAKRKRCRSAAASLAATVGLNLMATEDRLAPLLS